MDFKAESKQIVQLILIFLVQVSLVDNQCIQIACNNTTKFRSFDGSCNNLKNPFLGAAFTPYQRLMPPRYGSPNGGTPKSVTGASLPNVRLLSRTLLGENNSSDSTYGLIALIWGQFVTHDIALSRSQADAFCCSPSFQLTNIFSDGCMTIMIPKDDPVYQNKECMQFMKTGIFRNPCNTSDVTPPQQASSMTHFLDLSQVYGNSFSENGQLRDFFGGLLTTSNINNYVFPPASSRGCVIDESNSFCFRIPDTRANQNPALVVLHTLLVRHHNYLADRLSDLHPEWGDERRFQEARRINIAIYQHITYTEYLPFIIGEAATVEILNNTYDESVNPSIINEFTGGAFRSLHSQIVGRMDLYSSKRRFESSVQLSNTLFKPGFLTRSGNVEKMLRGMIMQEMGAMDTDYDEEITRKWLRFDNELGLDLRAIDIQRGRDHGLASYNTMREYCELTRAIVFEDFVEINNASIQLLKSLYLSPDDVDLYIGGILETLVEDSQFGPTFQCIVKKQFLNIMVSDRFFYTSDDPKIRFTPEQMNEITSKSSLASFICYASHIGKVQKDAFKYQIDPDTNPLLNCANMPEIDFTLW